MHDHPRRDLIIDQYAARHGATPATDYPACLTLGRRDAPIAVLTPRAGAHGALLQEAHLDRPLETVGSERFGRPVARIRVEGCAGFFGWVTTLQRSAAHSERGGRCG